MLFGAFFPSEDTSSHTLSPQAPRHTTCGINVPVNEIVCVGAVVRLIRRTRRRESPDVKR